MAGKKSVDWGRVRQLKSGWQANEPIAGSPGKYRPAPAPFETKKEAKDWLANRHREMKKGKASAELEGIDTFESWATRWLDVRKRKLDKGQIVPDTYGDYEGVLRLHVNPFLGSYRLDKINHDVIADFQDWLAAKETKPRAYQKAEKYAGFIMSFAMRKGAIEENPFKNEEVVVSDRAFHRSELKITTDEVFRLMDTIDQNYRAMISVVCFMGLRAGELWGLRVRDVDLFNNRLTVKRNLTDPQKKFIPEGATLSSSGQLVGRTKTKTDKFLDIPLWVAEELKVHLKNRNGQPEDPLFVSPDGHEVRHRNFYRRTFKPALKAAKVDESIVFHSLRHFCGSFYLGRKYPPLVVQQMLGHSNQEMTRLYSHILPGVAAALHKDSEAWMEQMRHDMAHDMERKLTVVRDEENPA